MQVRSKNSILLIIVFAQFACTSLWFASNAVMAELALHFNLKEGAVGNLTSSVQFGFITGTLVLAFLNLVDRFSPRRVFLTCAILGSFFNILVLLMPLGIGSLLLYRFLTGFCLAGIYPVGMKIAADWFPEGLGKALGFLVGALVLGTAFPHLIKAIGTQFDWTYVLWSVSLLAVGGALLLFILVDDGPHRLAAQSFNPRALFEIFRIRDFRSAAFGYFGHMWELYTFWAFVPFLLEEYLRRNTSHSLDVSLWSFLIIGSGFLGCAIGGMLVYKYSSAKVAFFQLAISMICCLLSVWMFGSSLPVFLTFLLVWGISVVGDSPQFSTLNALTAPKEWMGSALTITTSIGFAITIVSIQLFKYLEIHGMLDTALVLLAVGPTLGLLETARLARKEY